MMFIQCCVDIQAFPTQIPVSLKMVNTRLEPRDLVEVVIGGEDIANAARYAKKKLPEKFQDFKQRINDKIVNKLTEDKSKYLLLDGQAVKILDNGQLSFSDSQINELESNDINNSDNQKETESRPKPSTNIKTRPKDLGIKEMNFEPKEVTFDSFEN